MRAEFRAQSQQLTQRRVRNRCQTQMTVSSIGGIRHRITTTRNADAGMGIAKPFMTSPSPGAGTGARSRSRRTTSAMVATRAELTMNSQLAHMARIRQTDHAERFIPVSLFFEGMVHVPSSIAMGPHFPQFSPGSVVECRAGFT